MVGRVRASPLGLLCGGWPGGEGGRRMEFTAGDVQGCIPCLSQRPQHESKCKPLEEKFFFEAADPVVCEREVAVGGEPLSRNNRSRGDI